MLPPPDRPRIARIMPPLGWVLLLLWPAFAGGAEPLTKLPDLLAAASVHALDVRAARAQVRAARARTAVTSASLWPRFSATLGYTRNQFPSVAQVPDGTGGLDSVVVVAENQVDLVARIEVPLINASVWRRVKAADTATIAGVVDVEVRQRAVEDQVVRQWTVWVGSAALSKAAARTVAASEASRQVVVGRRAAGFADAAASARADAEVARAQQSVAEAKLGVDLAAGALQTLTGVELGSPTTVLDDDLARPAPMPTWLEQVDRLPAVRAATLRARSISVEVGAEWLGYVPRLDAHAQERVTNAKGFGETGTWSAGVTASWLLDRGTVARSSEREAAHAAAVVDVARARQDALDAIRDAHHRVCAQIEQVTAARAEAAALIAAQVIIRARFASGDATQLEVVQGERDVFAAEVARIRAVADLIYARAHLRLAAGRDAVGGDRP